jgi:ABC-type molybdate transport system permease subunit
MGFLDQIFFLSLVLPPFIEIGLIVTLFIKKERFKGEKSREIFQKNIKTFYSVSTIFLVSLLIFISVEVLELFEAEISIFHLVDFCGHIDYTLIGVLCPRFNYCTLL